MINTIFSAPCATDLEKKTDRRGSEGFRGVGGGSYRKRCHQEQMSSPPSLADIFSSIYNLPPISVISLFLSFSVPHHPPPPPPSCPAPLRRDREDENLQVALSSRDSDQCIFLLLAGITGNKQVVRLQRCSFPPCQGDIYVAKG